MSSSKIAYPLDRAAWLAEQVRDALAPGCERIEIAGSIRRKAKAVHDIEIVAIPSRGQDLLGQPAAESELDPIVRKLLRDERLRAGRCAGERYRNYMIPRDGHELSLDLSLVTRETWGVLFAIRTGPAEYSKAIVTPRSAGGLLDEGHIVRDGCLWLGIRDRGLYAADHRIDTPEERDFLAHAGGWVEPEHRGRDVAPAAPVARGSETSRAAAESVKPDVGRQETKVLIALQDAGTRGLTDHEGAAETGLQLQSYIPRRNALCSRGLVFATKRTRETGTGCRARVWSVKKQ